FGRERDGAVSCVDVKRLDAEGVADEPGAAVGADEAEGVHAAQAIEGSLAFLRVDVQQRFEIGASVEFGAELIFFGELNVIIDFAVADDRAACGVQRLPAAFEIDDREARVGEGVCRALFDADAIGAAVGDGVDQRLRAARFTDDAGDAAHQRPPNLSKSACHWATMAFSENLSSTRRRPEAMRAVRRSGSVRMVRTRSARAA